MPKCCGASCDCNIQAGAGMVVTGIGSIDVLTESGAPCLRDYIEERKE